MAPQAAHLGSPGKAGTNHPKSRPFLLPFLGSLRRRLGRTWPDPHAGPRPRAASPSTLPHLRAQLGRQLLQPPQERPLFRLHPCVKLGPGSRDKAGACLKLRFAHVTVSGGERRGVELRSPCALAQSPYYRFPRNQGVFSLQ